MITMNTSLFRILWLFISALWWVKSIRPRLKEVITVEMDIPSRQRTSFSHHKRTKKKWRNDVSSFRLTVKRQIGNSINQPLRRLHQVRVIDVNHKVSLLLASKIRKPFKRHERKTSYTFFKLSGTLPGIKKSSFFSNLETEMAMSWRKIRSIRVPHITFLCIMIQK